MSWTDKNIPDKWKIPGEERNENLALGGSSKNEVNRESENDLWREKTGFGNKLDEEYEWGNNFRDNVSPLPKSHNTLLSLYKPISRSNRPLHPSLSFKGKPVSFTPSS